MVFVRLVGNNALKMPSIVLGTEIFCKYIYHDDEEGQEGKDKRVQKKIV